MTTLSLFISSWFLPINLCFWYITCYVRDSVSVVCAGMGEKKKIEEWCPLCASFSLSCLGLLICLFKWHRCLLICFGPGPYENSVCITLCIWLSFVKYIKSSVNYINPLYYYCKFLNSQLLLWLQPYLYSSSPLQEVNFAFINKKWTAYNFLTFRSFSLIS